MNNQELLLHQLFQTVRAVTKGVNLTFENYNLHSSEWAIITTLKQAGTLTQGDLANYLNIEPPAVSRTLVVLINKGLIDRITGDDKREKLVSLSRKALALYPVLLEISQNHRQSMLTGLSEKQQIDLENSLKTIFYNAQHFIGSQKDTQKEDDSADV